MIEINFRFRSAWDPLHRFQNGIQCRSVNHAETSPRAVPTAPAGVSSSRIARLAVFAGLPDAESDDLARLARERRAVPGEVLFRSGETCASVFGLLDGSAKLVRRAGGRDTVIDLLGPGDLLGDTALFSGRGHECDAVALTECRLLCLASLPLLRHLQHAPRTAIALLTHMSRRVERLGARVESHARFSAEQAVAGFLLEHCDGNGVLGRTGAACGRRDLSALLRLRPETLSRALSRFRRAGWLRERGDGRQVVDRAALAACLPAGAERAGEA